jgi:hypothetical protein
MRRKGIKDDTEGRMSEEKMGGRKNLKRKKQES